ncbi:MAG: hypothetical protein JW783_13845 [Bacteroidales bacterium]|nr:hypothetical protein [Bacteroidales bacterium]MBN2750416.1 hypothetical protein [Bacteroidales bacterium]
MSVLQLHTFHIPVMGIGYTLDSPVKVAHLGITSVVSLLDDMLMEKLREFHSKQMGITFQSISNKVEDFRAERITAFLNLMDSMVKEKVDEMKSAIATKRDELDKYFDMLPDASEVKLKFNELKQHATLKELKQWLQSNIHPGDIDVNIMTKIDKENYNSNNEKLPIEYNDAHAAIRGFAKSNLESAVVLSAGMSPKLYSYIEKWDDFYPNAEGIIKKRVTIKVSDFRSAMVQGKFLANKGIWVSEFRVESGLNCGGHAFATQGNLLGPILEEFRANREVLINSMFEGLTKALKGKDKVCPAAPPRLRITAQGGVGTTQEHQFLLNHYGMDSVGWGTPFLLVPEAVSIDNETCNRLADAREDDLYLSNISPLGVPFNNLRGNTKDAEKNSLIEQDKPGSPCIKQYCMLNSEFTEKPICSASRQYQRKKIEQLKQQYPKGALLNAEITKVTDKSCICVGLGTAALKGYNLDTKAEGAGVSVCPGPNMAYFDEKVSLKRMVDHIYGRTNIIKRTDRPNFFIKELDVYLNYVAQKVETVDETDTKQVDYLDKFLKNLLEGIAYYKELFSQKYRELSLSKEDALGLLSSMEVRLEKIASELRMMMLQPV